MSTEDEVTEAEVTHVDVCRLVKVLSTDDVADVCLRGQGGVLGQNFNMNLVKLML